MALSRLTPLRTIADRLGIVFEQVEEMAIAAENRGRPDGDRQLEARTKIGPRIDSQ